MKEGLELDQHYVYRFCSPSRSCLMSGRLLVHVNDQNAEPNIYNPDDKVSGYAGIPTGLASKMQEAGIKWASGTQAWLLLTTPPWGEVSRVPLGTSIMLKY